MDLRFCRFLEMCRFGADLEENEMFGMSSNLADFGDGELWKSVEIGVFLEIADRES